MNWQKIDLWPKGLAGTDAKYRVENRVLYCFVHGSDHVLDWAHHFLPGAAKRERAGADVLYGRLMRMIAEFDRVVIGGHSIGAVVAIAVSDMLEKRKIPVLCYSFGGKRPLDKPGDLVQCYRRAGDIVPFLPPWRPKYREIWVFGKWTPFFLAHNPTNYDELRRNVGLK